MAKLLKWFATTASKLFDPQREIRINAAAERIKAAITSQRKSFKFDEALATCEVFGDEHRDVAQAVYKDYFKRAFRDRVIDGREREALDWIAAALSIRAEKTAIEKDVVVEAFDTLFVAALSDGEITDAELESLRSTAAQAGLGLESLLRERFVGQIQSYCRTLFAGAMADGVLSSEEWTRFLATMARVGFRAEEVKSAVEVQARQLVEHAMADAKSDGRLSDSENAAIRWLLANTLGESPYASYVRAELDRIERLQAILDGNLPSVRVNAIGLKAGEIVHFHTAAQFVKERKLRSGTVQDRFDGQLLLTDNRLLFTGVSTGLEVNHRRVTGVDPVRGGFLLRTSGKQGGWFLFSEAAEPLGTLIYQTAVRKANQTVVLQTESAPSRHISRDVRQRVWQIYGGRCAACGSEQYLEFDHIIPVAKGGSSTEQNVQLLCRKCNLQKSDHI